jgi:hypothetical protein
LQIYRILKINTNDKSFEIIDYKDILDADINGFEATGNKILLSGLSSGRPFVMHFDPQTGQQKPLQSLPQEKVQFSTMQTDESSKEIFVAVVGKFSQLKEAYFYRYDSLGNHLQTVSIPNNIDYSLQTFRFYSHKGEAFVVFGTYAQRNSTRPQGVFTLHFDKENLISERFYDFGYLKNYYSYLNEKAQEKISKRVKKADSNENFIRHTLDFTVGEIKNFGDEITLTLEGYIPIFNQTGSSLDNPLFSQGLFRYNSLGRYYLRQNRFSDYGNRIPSSYKYKNALILGFDHKGKLLWDNSFEYDDYESLSPPSPLAVSLKNDSLFVMDFFDNNFFLKTGLKNKNTSKPEKVPPPKKINELEILQTENGKVFHWFDKFYIYEARQNVKSLKDDKKRRVYSLMKITIENHGKTSE